MNEEWRTVPGYEGLYQVSSLGRVKSLARTYRALRSGTAAEIPIPERILALTIVKVGYPAVALCKDGSHRTSYVHHLVCEAWHGPRPKCADAAHFDGNKTNNRPENLRWATRRENLKDKVRHGRQPRGNDLWFTKVSDEDVARIRAAASEITSFDWARELGVSASHIRAIRNGAERRHAGAAL